MVADERYLNALSAVDGPSATAKQLDRVCQSAKFHKRRRRGLNLSLLLGVFIWRR